MKKMISQLGRYLLPDARSSRPDRRTPAFTRLGGLAGALSLLLSQTTDATIIAVQDFETSPATPTATYIPSGGSLQTGSSTLTDRPDASPFYSGGAQSYQVNNGIATLTFDAINTSGYTDIQLTLRVAAFSIGTSGNGLDATDYVEVQISPNNGANYYPTVRVAGNSPAYWSYAGGTGNASTPYDGDGSVVQFAPIGTGNRTTDGYSTITITSLPAISQLRVKIIMFNNSVNERWVIDDLQITGTPNIAPPRATTAPSAPIRRSTSRPRPSAARPMPGPGPMGSLRPCRTPRLPTPPPRPAELTA